MVEVQQTAVSVGPDGMTFMTDKEGWAALLLLIVVLGIYVWKRKVKS